MRIPKPGEIWRQKNIWTSSTWNRFEVLEVREGWVKFRMKSDGPIPQPSSWQRLGLYWGRLAFGGFLSDYELSSEAKLPEAKEHHGLGRSWPPYSPEGAFLGPQTKAVETLTIKPGQILVVSVDGYLTAAMACDLREQWKNVCPDAKLVVLPKGMHLTVLGRVDVEKDAS